MMKMMVGNKFRIWASIKPNRDWIVTRAAIMKAGYLLPSLAPLTLEQRYYGIHIRF